MIAIVSTSPEDVMRQLLRRHQHADALRFDVRNNHAPMVLIAMYRMGASADDMRRYYEGLTIPPIERVSATIEVGCENWREHLGEFAAWPAYCRYFQSEVEGLGAESALRMYLSPLMQGVAAHAFHPLLRTAYGIELGDPAEIAFGLAYWASTFLPVPEAPGDLDPVNPQVLLERLMASEPLRSVKADSNSITGRIQTIFDHPAYQAMLHPLNVELERPAEALARTLAYCYSELHHFTILHGITSCHAMRTVLPYLEDQQRAIDAYWHAVAAAYLTVINVVETKPAAVSRDDMTWSQIHAQAIESMNEHTIKFVYTCQQESAAYGGTAYQCLAIREVHTPAQFV